MNVNPAISTLYRAIEEKTEKGVSNALENSSVELYQRTDILRRMFVEEKQAQRALARAMRAVQQYIDN